MPALIPIGIVIFIIWYVVPRLGDLFTPAAPPPAPPPTVVVVDSGDSGMTVLLTGALFIGAVIIAIAVTAVLTLWLARRSHQRQEQRIAEAAAVYARPRTHPAPLPGSEGAPNATQPRSAIRYH